MIQTQFWSGFEREVWTTMLLGLVGIVNQDCGVRPSMLPRCGFYVSQRCCCNSVYRGGHAVGGCCPLGIWQQLIFFLLELPCHPTESSVQMVTLLGSVLPGTFLAFLFSSRLVLDLWPHPKIIFISVPMSTVPREVGSAHLGYVHVLGWCFARSATL